MNEFGAVITSSPFLTPQIARASVKASVPLLSATAYFDLQYLAIFFSNLFISYPPT